MNPKKQQRPRQPRRARTSIAGKVSAAERLTELSEERLFMRGTLAALNAQGVDPAQKMRGFLVEFWRKARAIEADLPDAPRLFSIELISHDWRVADAAFEEWLEAAGIVARRATSPARAWADLPTTVRRIAAYIKKHPGRKGAVIASELRIGEEHFRRLFKQLRPLGFQNRKPGYYAPPKTSSG